MTAIPQHRHAETVVADPPCSAKQIRVDDGKIAILENHAMGGMPNESCAMLFGDVDGGTVTVSDVLLTENVRKSPGIFSISGEQLLQAHDMSQEIGREIVGIFHSHPVSTAYPSVTDVEFMCINPVVWLIYSGKYMNFRAYVLNDGVKEIAVNETALRND